MGFRFYSLPFRQQDWTCIWAVSAESTKGTTAEISIVNDANVSTVVHTGPVGALTTLSGLTDNIKPATLPLPSSSKYHISVKNTGTESMELYGVISQFRKPLPGETVAPNSADDHGITGAALTTIQDEYDFIANNMPDFVTWVNDAMASCPSALTGMFSALTPSSSTSDYLAIINSSAFKTFYGKVSPLITAALADPVTATNGMSTPLEIPAGQTLSFEVLDLPVYANSPLSLRFNR